MDIGAASLANADVRALIATHQRQMFEASPPGTSFALDLSGLEKKEVTIFDARGDGELLAVGALMVHSDREGEIKSMRTADHALRKGAGKALLAHIVHVARERGYERLLLETGAGPIFEPANRLYSRNGFVRRGPFADYAETGFNIFYEKLL